jgi:hypothetical protein
MGSGKRALSATPGVYGGLTKNRVRQIDSGIQQTDAHLRLRGRILRRRARRDLPLFGRRTAPA